MIHFKLSPDASIKASQVRDTYKIIVNKYTILTTSDKVLATKCFRELNKLLLNLPCTGLMINRTDDWEKQLLGIRHIDKEAVAWIQNYLDGIYYDGQN